MKKTEKIVIVLTLVFIIISSFYLILRLETDAKSYDPELYAQIYDEANEFVSHLNKNSTLNQTPATSSKLKKPIYKVIAMIRIPKLNLDYPVISETNEEYLKIAPTKLWGAEPNQVGNLCIISHNFENGRLFSNIDTLQNGDIVKIQSEEEKSYSVYKKYTVDSTDLSCTSQATNGKTEITLITCTNRSDKRLVIKCTMM